MPRHGEEYTKGELFKKIDEFFDEQIPSNGGYADVSEHELLKFRDIIYGIAELKWERDADGGLPISVRVRNKHTEQPDYYSLIKRADADLDLEELKREIELAENNMQVAGEQRSSLVRELIHRVKMMQELKGD